VPAIALPSPRPSKRENIKFQAEKVLPDSSPKVTPDGQFGGGNGAMRSVEQSAEKMA
jgi:hypothetical protein